MAFEINDKVVHANGGVFIIVDIKTMNYGAGDKNYYCLKSYLSHDQNGSLVIYVPVDKADGLIRYLISEDEAKSLLESFKDLKTVWFDNIKERKNKFFELISSKNIINSCIVLKSLFLKQRNVEIDNKPLKIIDIDYLKKTRLKVIGELSIVLNRPEKEIEESIKSMI